MTFEIQNDYQFRLAIGELDRRQEEALRIFRPQLNQLPFLLSDASEKVLRGGNRSGKTTTVAAEVASAATGIPLYGPDGEELPFLYPRRPLMIWTIGYDERHIARIQKKLFRPGVFRCLRDPETGRLRAWNPLDEEDMAREDETVPSPPFIPPRLVDPTGWAWDGKVEGCFRMCRLKNGTEIHAFASGAEAGQGEAVDIVWIDEDIKIEGHVEEWQARLTDNRGRLLWSVWPHTVNNALRLMSKRAEQQKDREHPNVFETVIKQSENPFLPPEEVQKRIEGWRAKGEAIVRARDAGEFVDDLVLVFPGYTEEVHCLPSHPSVPRDRLETFLAARNFKVPITWTNYLVLDPGHTHPAVLLAAVPPPEEFGFRVVIWDEICESRIDAIDVAEIASEKMAGRTFQTFLIDYRAGRQKGMAGGKRTVDLWEDAFAAKRLKSQTTDSGFTFGSDDITARNMIVRRWLGKGPDGFPALRLIEGTTPTTQNQFHLYKKRVAQEDVKDEVVDKHNDTMDCLGYLAAFGPEYVEPESIEPTWNAAYRQFKKMHVPRHGDNTVYVGAGAAPNEPVLSGVPDFGF